MIKVLHLISGGDTGGAKTHIMTLLNEMQNHIDVRLGVFFKDVFLDEAKDLGISTVVFEQKSRFDLSVVNDIVEYVNKEGIDLVHCHGARANFIAFFLMRKLKKVKFLSTLHSDPRLDFKGNFYKQLIFKNLNTFALKRFKNYVAVSDDFKNMLLNRGFSKKNIDVVYNGINLEAEDKYVPKEEFLDRYNIRHDGIKIGILARLDEVKDHRTFIRAAGEFLKEADADFLIGGSGGLLDELKKMAEDFGISDRVHFLGEVKDPFSFINAIDINVLSSLSESFPYVILEGAKYSKPMVATHVGGIPKVVIDDYSGYTYEPGDYKKLSERLLDLAKNDEKRIQFGKNIHNIVLEKYSSHSMSRMQLDIYNKILFGKTIVLSGFYGFDNQGDDAILEAILGELKRRDKTLRLKVLSNNPNKTREVYDVDAVYRFNPFVIGSTIKKGDMLISGGGSLLQDVTSSRSLWYYLYVISVAKRKNKKVCIYANGVGPINGKFNRKLTKKVLKDVDLITLRDDDSAKYLEEIGIEKDKCLVRSDPVFLLKENIEEAEKILSDININDEFIVVNLRPWTDDEKMIDQMAIAINKLMDQGHKILLIPMHMSKDTPILKRLEDKCQNENLYSYYEDMSVTTLMGIFSKAQMVLAMRLHGVIYSAAVHTKPLAISYDPKVTSFMESIDSDYIIDINDIDGQKVYQEIKRCLDDEDYLSNIKNKDEERKELARLNAIEALGLLKDIDEKN